MTSDELNREIDGFGCPSIRLQLHHIIGAQKYWIGVLEGRIDVDEDYYLYPTIDSLELYRVQIFELATKSIKAATPDELNSSRKMTTWGGRERMLIPAHVILRTATHIYHHQGQIMAMCRLLGKPGPEGLDFPIV